jgi:hypothetical protein
VKYGICSSTYLQDNKLELGNIVRMHPVFCCLTDEILLSSTSRRVSDDRVTTSTDEVVQLRQLDNEGIVVVFEKRLRSQASSKDGF